MCIKVGWCNNSNLCNITFKFNQHFICHWLVYILSGLELSTFFSVSLLPLYLLIFLFDAISETSSNCGRPLKQKTGFWHTKNKWNTAVQFPVFTVPTAGSNSDNCGTLSFVPPIYFSLTVVCTSCPSISEYFDSATHWFLLLMQWIFLCFFPVFTAVCGSYSTAALRHIVLLPEWVPSFISRGAAHTKRRERPLLAKEGTISLKMLHVLVFL